MNGVEIARGFVWVLEHVVVVWVGNFVSYILGSKLKIVFYCTFLAHILGWDGIAKSIEQMYYHTISYKFVALNFQ
jgi:hypothetical protein